MSGVSQNPAHAKPNPSDSPGAQGPGVLVFASGAGESAGAPLLKALREELAPAGIHVVALGAPAGQPAERDRQLMQAFRQARAELPLHCRLFLGGHSRGARIARALGVELGASGWIGFGYPFHGAREAIDRLRIRELCACSLPGLICQGTRDAHGNRDQVRSYGLPAHLQMHWMENFKHRLGAEQLVLREGRAALEASQCFLKSLL